MHPINNRSRNFLLSTLIILMIIFLADLSIAKQLIFEREYTYQASEIDSKVSCRANALEQVKRLLLEELGTYLESRTEVRNFKLTKDQIITLTAGIVRTEIVKERWDFNTYWMKAKIEANPDEVIKSVDSLRKDHQKTKELEETREKAAEYLKEMERLRSELALAKGDTRKQGEYNEAVKGLRATDWFEKGEAYREGKKYQVAISAYNKAIELDPKYKNAYLTRGAAYGVLGNYQQAISDFTRAIELDPKHAYAYNNRGVSYGKLGNYQQAIFDISRAIEIYPGYTLAYTNRGLTYGKSGKYLLAISDFTRAIELDPKDAHAYYNRGITYSKSGNLKQAIKDYKIAARLGYKQAQNLLSKKGIDW
ncbi:MAG: tetratricopeptide repeat protein [Pseudomonadota bacterium]